jgi:hypothetical protein
MSCRQQPAPPLRDATKMSPRISICPEPVLSAHTLSRSAAGSHCPAREGSGPHWGTDQPLCSRTVVGVSQRIRINLGPFLASRAQSQAGCGRSGLLTGVGSGSHHKKLRGGVMAE